MEWKKVTPYAPYHTVSHYDAIAAALTGLAMTGGCRYIEVGGGAGGFETQEHRHHPAASGHRPRRRRSGGSYFARCYTRCMLKFVLSAHAETVIAERSIPIAWVEQVLTSPEKTQPDKEDPQLTHALGRIPEHGGRVLRVVYNGVIEPARVVTVYFDRTQRNKP